MVVPGSGSLEVRRQVELWIGCVAKALAESEYRLKLVNAGFETVELEPTRIYRADDAAGFPLHQSEGIDASPMDGKFMSAFIRTRKPLAA